jgi:hypothetical protein
MNLGHARGGTDQGHVEYRALVKLSGLKSGLAGTGRLRARWFDHLAAPKRANVLPGLLEAKILANIASFANTLSQAWEAAACKSDL